MKSRIKKIRILANQTQSQMAQSLGCSLSYIAQLEIGKKLPTNMAIKSICSAYNVSETWLRTGEGEMFISPSPAPATEPRSVAIEYIKGVLGSLPPEVQEKIYDFCMDIALLKNSQDTPPKDHNHLNE